MGRFPYRNSCQTCRVPARTIPLDRPLDLVRTIGINRRGAGDPTIRLGAAAVVRATRTADGPGTLHVRHAGDRIEAEAWGPGAERLLSDLPAMVGLDDDGSVLRPVHPVLRDMARRLPGLRIGRTGNVMEALVPAIIEQKVTGSEAFRAWRLLVTRYGERAPGPWDVWVPPSMDRIAALPYHAFHPLGVERRRADTIRRVTARAPRLAELPALPLRDAYRRMTSFPGVGPWTAAEVALRALGDPDAVSIGDFHLPNLVSWVLAREPRGDDTRMLELLEPYKGQRGRVVRLLEASGMRPPAYGPRLAPRRIEAI
jgi:3-methyladenine DNA glycosylase/8-oxoguanine DNA glycosylase